MQSRRHLNVRGKSATLPAVTDKDWLDLKFGVEVGVDYYALSFVQVGGGGCGLTCGNCTAALFFQMPACR
jgi:hypothetical protein